jgi:hypothetical protein
MGNWCAIWVVVLAFCGKTGGVRLSAGDPPASAAVGYRVPAQSAVPAWAAGTLYRRRPPIDELDRVLLVVVREGAWVPTSQRLDGGVADRFTGIVTHLVAAIAANATFLLEWPELERYYRPRFDFMVGRPAVDRAFPGELLRLPRLQQFPFQDKREGRRLRAHLSEHRLTAARVSHGYLHCFWSNGRVYRPRGCIVPEFWKSDRLDAVTAAFTFRHAFRELFNTLFEPTELTKSVLARVAAPILTPDPPVPRGTCFLLQIRLGDKQISQGAAVENFVDAGAADHHHTVLGTAKAFFQCAEKLEKTRGGDSGSARWFVMTDSETVKRYAVDRYPKKAIVNSLGRATASSYNMSDPTDPLLHVIAEQWVGTLCDVHIVTRDSGLGRQAAFRSTSTEDTVCYGHDCSCFSWYGVAMDWSEI